MTYLPADDRYATALFRRCGRSGLDLPSISLGLWQNFGGTDVFETGRAVLRRAFDRGVTHFDLANNYGPPYGLGRGQLRPLDGPRLPPAPRRTRRSRPRPAGTCGPAPTAISARANIIVASCDASLKRMGLNYVDIFYHHRPDPKTPLEETIGALDHLVRAGKALYVGSLVLFAGTDAGRPGDGMKTARHAAC